MAHVETVWIVRHGETDFNASGRWQGHYDSALNERGHDQARALAAHLLDTGIEHIYSSDLQRCIQTAQPLADQLGTPVQIESRLREIHVGVFQGLTRAEVERDYADVYARYRVDDNFTIPNGESRIALQTRSFEAWEDLTSQQHVSTVLMVTHGGTLRMLMKRLFPHERGIMGPVGNTALTRIRWRAGNWHIESLYDRSWLPPALI